jgi:hypothetical protein
VVSWAGRVAQVVKCLCSKCEALSSTLVLPKVTSGFLGKGFDSEGKREATHLSLQRLGRKANRDTSTFSLCSFRGASLGTCMSMGPSMAGGCDWPSPAPLSLASGTPPERLPVSPLPFPPSLMSLCRLLIKIPSESILQMEMVWERHICIFPTLCLSSRNG